MVWKTRNSTIKYVISTKDTILLKYLFDEIIYSQNKNWCILQVHTHSEQINVLFIFHYYSFVVAKYFEKISVNTTIWKHIPKLNLFFTVYTSYLFSSKRNKQSYLNLTNKFYEMLFTACDIYMIKHISS